MTFPSGRTLADNDVNYRESEPHPKWVPELMAALQYRAVRLDRWEERMKDDDSKQFDNLSNLTKDLKVIENQGGVDHAAGLDAARETVVGAIRGMRASLYQLAEALEGYHNYFKGEHIWTSVLDRVARGQGCSARTLYRLIENYKEAQRLPQIVVDAMIESHIEPTSTKNRDVVQIVAQIPETATREDAAAAVKLAHSRVIAMKRTAKAETAPVEPGSLEEFTRRIVRMFEARFGSYSPSHRDDEVRFILEKVVNCLRANVRELRTYSRADQVRKPAAAKGEI